MTLPTGTGVSEEDALTISGLIRLAAENGPEIAARAAETAP